MSSRKQFLISVAFGLLGALCAGAFIMLYANGLKAEQAKLTQKFGGPSPAVLVARQTVHPGEEIKKSDFEARQWASYLLPNNPVLETDASDIENKVAGSLILPGEILTQERLTADTSLLRNIKPGHSAVTVSSSPSRALGGHLLPGMFVDLYSQSGDQGAQALATQAEILFTSNTPDRNQGTEPQGFIKGTEKPKSIEWVTLSVPDDMVDFVVAASFANNIYLVLPGE